MRIIVRLLIVATLIIAVGIVMYLKQDQKAERLPRETDTSSDKAIPRLLDLGATRCIPCKMMAPILEELRNEYQGKLEVIFIDVWENKDAIGQYDVRVIPTQIFFDANGKELFRHAGFYSKEEILGKWKELGVDLETKHEDSAASP
ncbi:MAG TPA: thioredoxin family protein [Thermodesulfobacteriota bacterium]|nr:thioredoxin family protein [Thermodesulfobacteriota bacterium]HNU72909.1 thioredoxin family protein [Thermodesulfobacteriota bacterium]HQO78882.1 thioredoxin family protein [Thermodesulfobacteriota bacterium]